MPTSKQIELAGRLQEFGICKSANYWILKRPEGVERCFVGHGVNRDELDAVGPLPTFEEVWTELTPLLKTKRKEFYLKMHVGYVGLFQYIKGSNDLFLEGWHCETTTESAIEALLYLNDR